ncbi:acyl-CoA synthetase [Rhodococcus sp. WB1]|uniref:Acyl-CoA synthetase n=1 Tax=Rhodococcus aetherivorans TaxID=191292 RepID=N1MBH7_9NOCA|nr:MULTISPECIES: acyl-CoA synthetase [Rhodococcus]ANZ23665.1 acyl-CoA synthetase [Rhodococcus sp. WB1]KDE10532.1 AMP-dependent synthetase [Rhodococcus aetherivorans]UYF95332.1 acyl-CoA synthetase [Rhodococcus aetherivorans]CCW14251.1 Long-chain-fatty-acid--CoA ligase [Rhodococcus aetherivorans]
MSLNLADLTEAVVDAIPDRTALSCGDESRTYAEFDARANRVAHYLAAVGVTAGDHVGLHMRNSLEFLEVMLGCLKIRAVPVNINFRYVGAELVHLYTDADLVALVLDDEFADVAAQAVPHTSRLRHIVVVGSAETAALEQAAAGAGATVVRYAEAAESASAERDFGERSGDDRYILYTGGTTGMPKGVMWRHEDFYFAALAGGNPYGEPHRSPADLAAAAAANEHPMSYLVTAPLMHGAAMYSVLMGLFTGAKQVLMRSFEPVEALRLIERHRIAIVMVVGDAISRPLADAVAARGKEFDLSSLLVIGSGGALWSASVRAQLAELLPNVYLRNSFGSSEAGATGTLDVGSDGRARISPSPTLRVVDTDLAEVEPGSETIGYLARIGHVPLGYYNDPDKSAATFPERDGVRMCLLGDLATVEPDGSIVVLGRGSACINTGGEKVYAEEVEEAVKSHPAVLDAVVAGVPDPLLGERVSVAVQFRPGVEAPSVTELADHCRTLIAGYKIPKTIVSVPEVMRSPAGKADYRWAKATLENATVDA